VVFEALVLDKDPVLWIGEVDTRHEVALGVANDVLEGRPRQASSHERIGELSLGDALGEDVGGRSLVER
jgi:hypothetical protein